MQALARLCAGMWSLGFVGLWVTKGFFDLGVGSLPFEVFTRLCIVGGLSLGFVGCLMSWAGERESA